MHASIFLACLSLASAAVVPRKPIVLSADDIILYSNEGRVEVRKRWEYPPLAGNNTLPPFDISNPYPKPAQKRSAPLSKEELQKRKDNTIIIENPAEDFVNWDVIMSSVVKGPASVAVTEGYSIANSISVGTSSSLTLVEDFLSVSMSIDYSQTWTSTYNAAYTFEVDAGKYGAVVSNPKTHRESGTVFSGRIGSEGSLTTYQADSYSSKAYGGLSWVDGVISLCQGDTYPLPRCIGSGTL